MKRASTKSSKQASIGDCTYLKMYLKQLGLNQIEVGYQHQFDIPSHRDVALSK